MKVLLEYVEQEESASETKASECGLSETVEEDSGKVVEKPRGINRKIYTPLNKESSSNQTFSPKTTRKRKKSSSMSQKNALVTDWLNPVLKPYKKGKIILGEGEERDRIWCWDSETEEKHKY